MKYEIDIPDSLLERNGKRYVPTGEFRGPKYKERFLSMDFGEPRQALIDFGRNDFRIILREAEPEKPAEDFARVSLVSGGRRHEEIGRTIQSGEGNEFSVTIHLRPVPPAFEWPAEWSGWDSLTCDLSGIYLWEKEPRLAVGLRYEMGGGHLSPRLIRLAYPHLKLPEMKPGERIVNPNRKESDREP